MARGGGPLTRPRREPDLLLFGATLLDAPRAAGRAPARAEAVWVRGGRILAVGPLAALRSDAGRQATRIDLGGGTLTPGFTDSHVHLVTWARALEEPWLERQEPEAIRRAARLRAASAPAEEWLLLRGWIPREWPTTRRAPETLDRIAPDRPLLLYAVDGHSVWANKVALERAGIDRRTPDPPGGRLDRDASGALTGVLIESAFKIATAAVRRVKPTRDDLESAIAKALSLGITSAHDFDRATSWRAAAELSRERPIPFRVLLSVPVASLEAARSIGLAAGLGGGRLRVGPVKMFADGTLGSATALLEEPYEGSGERGIEVTPPDELRAACSEAADAGLTVAIHAIGDRAVRNALDAVEATLQAGKVFPLPPRIEHIQLSRREDWPRFRRLGVLASVQPVHVLSDRPVARRFWGSRTARSYAWKSLAAAGAKLIFGSDAPFDRAGPLRAIQAALLRREGEEPPDHAFHPEQRLKLAASMRAHLEDPHLAAGWPLPLGRLAPGWGADLVHFDHDLVKTPIEEWHRVRARSVWVSGARALGHRGAR